MANDQIVVGLDIGTTKICAIVGKMNEYGKINILGLGKAESHEAVEHGVVKNIDKTVECIRNAVAAAEKQSGIEINVVYVGIAGEHIRSMQQKGLITLNNFDAEITKEDVQRLHREMYKIPIAPGSEIIHVLPQTYTVDNQTNIKNPVGMAGVRLEGNFHVVTAQSTAANNIYKCIRKAGLDARNLLLEPLASSRAVLSPEEKEAGVCLVDIGGGTTDVAIFEDSIIRHTAVIPFGGNVITNDIKQGLNILKRYAENLKTQYGVALTAEIRQDEIITIPGVYNRGEKDISRRMLAGIIQARMTEIMEFVAQEIRIAGYERALPGGIVVTGGGSMLSHTKQLVEFVTGLDARIGLPGEHLASGLINEVNAPLYSTGVGLVLMGMEHESRESNDLISSPNRETASSKTVAASQSTEIKSPMVETQDTPPINEKDGGFLGKIKGWFEATMNNSDIDN